MRTHDCQIRWRFPGKGTRCLTTRSPDYLSIRRSDNDSLLPSPTSRPRNWATSLPCGRSTSRSPRSRTQAVFPSQSGIPHRSPRQRRPLLRARNPRSHSQPLARFGRRARPTCGPATIYRSDRERRPCRTTPGRLNSLDPGYQAFRACGTFPYQQAVELTPAAPSLAMASAPVATCCTVLHGGNPVLLSGSSIQRIRRTAA